MAAAKSALPPPSRCVARAHAHALRSAHALMMMMMTMIGSCCSYTHAAAGAADGWINAHLAGAAACPWAWAAAAARRQTLTAPLAPLQVRRGHHPPPCPPPPP